MKYLTWIILASIFFLGCNKEDDDGGTPGPTGPIELANTGLEDINNGLPVGWWSNPGPYELFTTDTTAFNGAYSAGLTSNDSTAQDFGFWAQTITDNIQVDKKLRLRVNIRAENVVGEGASIVIRGDNTLVPQGPAELFITTQDDLYIGGTHNWKEYRVALEDPITSDIQSITVYVILLPNTSGTIFFDDIILEYE